MHIKTHKSIMKINIFMIFVPFNQTNKQKGKYITTKENLF